MLEGHRMWMIKGTSQHIIDLGDKRPLWETRKGKIDYQTTYWKVSVRKIMRTVNVKGESIVNSRKCIMERTSPWPHTVTTTIKYNCLNICQWLSNSQWEGNMDETHSEMWVQIMSNESRSHKSTGLRRINWIEVEPIGYVWLSLGSTSDWHGTW